MDRFNEIIDLFMWRTTPWIPVRQKWSKKLFLFVFPLGSKFCSKRVTEPWTIL